MRNGRGLLVVGALLAVAAFALVYVFFNQKSSTQTPAATATASLATSAGSPVAVGSSVAAVTSPVAAGTPVLGSAVSTPVGTATPAINVEVVANRNIPADLRIANISDLVRYFKDYPIPAGQSAPRDAVGGLGILSTNLISNTVHILNPVRAGNPILNTDYELEPFSPPTSLSNQIRPGRVGISIAVLPLAADNALIFPGDYVNLLLTLHQKDFYNRPIGAPDIALGGSATTQQLLTSLRVIDARPVLGNYTLEMSPQDSLLVKYVKDTGGAIEMTLISAEDVKTRAKAPQTNPVVPDYFLTPMPLVQGTPNGTPVKGVPYPFSTPFPTLTATPVLTPGR